MMTSFAFILGVVPLVIADGAGAEMRRTLGTAVFSGMLGVTLFGIFLTPVFFYVIQKLAGKKEEEDRSQEAGARRRQSRVMGSEYGVASFHALRGKGSSDAPRPRLGRTWTASVLGASHARSHAESWEQGNPPAFPLHPELSDSMRRAINSATSMACS